MRLKNQFSTRTKLLWGVGLSNVSVVIIYILYLIFCDVSDKEVKRLLVYFKISQLMSNAVLFSLKDRYMNQENVSACLSITNIIFYISSLMLHYFLSYRLCLEVFGHLIHYFFIANFFLIFINFSLLVYWVYFEKFEVPKSLNRYRLNYTSDI